eukprot:15365133-Ditylum_brightwellii.AAC.1
MTIFCNTKETNEALDIVAAKVEQEDNTYVQNYGTTMVEANYEVQIKPSKPLIVAGRNHVETNALSVYVLRSHARILQDLMLCVALHVGQSGFKFIPANLPYDKSICDGKQRYANLLKEQNQYLANYKDVCIGGVTNEMLSREFKGKTLQDHLKLQDVVSNITQTVFTETKGIWQVETTRKQVVKAMRRVTETLD